MLTNPYSLSFQAQAEIERLGARTVIIVGGSAAVAPAVELQVKNLSTQPSVKRLWGDTRTETALDIMKYGSSFWGDTLIIANGFSFADALSISSYAAASATPIVLTLANGELDAQTISTVRAHSFKNILIVGGSSAVSGNVRSQLGSSYNYVQLGGADRYETSTLIAQWACGQSSAAPFAPSVKLSFDNVVVASGANFPDALAGVSLSGAVHAPLLLVENDASCNNIQHFLKSHSSEVSYGYVLGGQEVLSEEVYTAIKQVTNAD